MERVGSILAFVMILAALVPNAFAVSNVVIGSLGEDGGYATPEASYDFDISGIILGIPASGNTTIACNQGNLYAYARIENSANTLNYTPWRSIYLYDDLNIMCLASQIDVVLYNYGISQITPPAGTYKIMSNFTLNLTQYKVWEATLVFDEVDASVRIGAPDSNIIVRKTMYNFTFRPASEEANASLCEFVFNNSPTVYENTTPIAMNVYNKRQFSFPDNSSIDYEYTVTCAIGGQEKTDSGAFRLRTDGSVTTEPLPALVYLVIICALAIGLMLALAGMATSGGSMTAKAMAIVMLLVIFAIVFQMIA